MGGLNGVKDAIANIPGGSGGGGTPDGEGDGDGGSCTDANNDGVDDTTGQACGGVCDPESPDYLNCVSGPQPGESDFEFESLQEQVDEKKEEFNTALEQARSTFSDLINIDGGTGEFTSHTLSVFGVDIEFGTVAFQGVLAYLPAVIMFMAAVTSAMILFGGRRE